MRPLSTRSRRARLEQNRSASTDRRHLHARRRPCSIRGRRRSAQFQNFVEPSVKRPGANTIIVGVDTGGTFTDMVAIIGDEIKVHKVLSTPLDPADAVIRGLHEMLDGSTPASVTYSSTVATNSLLEKKGQRVALITNAGFEDQIDIGRQNRAALYALAPSRPH